MRVLDLFSGIGGFALGMEMAGGYETVAFCEVDPFCREVLKKHWPGVPIFDDVRTLTTDALRPLGRIDLVCGGFPCQDISCAGKGAGIRASRSGLFWEMLRIVQGMQPHWCLFENVPALRTRGADEVLAAMEEAGYECWPLVVGAEHIAAPHKRHRVWIVCQLADPARTGQREQPQAQRPDGLRTGQGGSESTRSGQLAEPTGTRREESRSCDTRTLAATTAPARLACWPARPGETQYTWEAPRLLELPVGGSTDGLSPRLVRAANRHALKAYGNSVCPQVVCEIATAIRECDERLMAERCLW